MNRDNNKEKKKVIRNNIFTIIIIIVLISLSLWSCSNKNKKCLDFAENLCKNNYSYNSCFNFHYDYCLNR
jgi:hypothetical protein